MPPVPRTAKKKAQPAAVDPVKIVIGVVAVCVAGIVLAVLQDTSAPTGDSKVHELLSDLGVRRRGVAIECEGGGSSCRVVATHALQRGEPVLKIPPAAIIDLRSIMGGPLGPALRHDNASVVARHLQAAQLHEGFANIFAFAFFLAVMRREGSGSPFQPWLATLPSTASMRGALFWDEARDGCLDAAARGEAAALRRGLATFTAIATELCAETECPLGGAPTEEELRWATGTYLATNFQDQAIIPGLSYARFDGTHEGAAPQWSEAEGVLNIVAGEPARRGEELFCAYTRGPTTQLTSRGFFDKGSHGVDARVRLPDPAADPVVKRRCHDHIAELTFGSNGRPRESLVECVAALVASKPQRRRLRHWRADLEHSASVWGNITGMLQATLEAFRDDDEHQQQKCEPMDALGQTMADYVAFTRRTLLKNHEYAASMQRRAAEAHAKVFPPAPTTPENSDDAAPEMP